MRKAIYITAFILGWSVTANAQIKMPAGFSAQSDSTLLSNVLQQLRIQKEEVNLDLCVHKRLPYDANKMVVVIPKYVEKGDGFTVFDAYVLVVDAASGKILHKYYRPRAWTSDAIRLTDITVDTGLYELNNTVRAFGIRTHHITSSSMNGYARTYLSLFIPDGKKLRRVLKSYPIKRTNGEWGFNNSEENYSKKVKSKIIIDQDHQYSGFHDLILKSEIIKREGFSRRNKGRKTITHQRVKLYFNGTDYTPIKLPDGFSAKKQLTLNLDKDAQKDIAVLAGDKTPFNHLLLIYLTHSKKQYKLDLRATFGEGSFMNYTKIAKIGGRVLEYSFFTAGTAHYHYAVKLRFNPQTQKVQVIGFDYGYNSGPAGRTREELSFNLLTGNYIRRHIDVFGEDRVINGKNTTFQQVYLENINWELYRKLEDIGLKDSLLDITGIYSVQAKNYECNMRLKLYKEKGQLKYDMQTSERNLRGHAKLEKEKTHYYLMLKNITWSYYTRVSDKSGKPIYPNAEVPNEVTGRIKNHVITIQNYGNTMHRYVKFSGCGDKYIRLVKD